PTERWRKVTAEVAPEKRLSTIVDGYLSATHRDDPGQGCAVPALGAEIARESPKTRKAFALKLDQMIDMIADQIQDVPRKTARKRSEEHTSELQSRFDLVCRLLLEKKKKMC